MAKGFLVIICMVVLAGCASLEETKNMYTKQKLAAVAPEKLVIASFDSGMKPNNIGGDFGAWDRDPKDETQFCEAEFSAEQKVGSVGHSLKLVYDVDSKQEAYNGFWMNLEKTDFRPYGNIAFSVKGDTQKGFTDKVVIELKNKNGEVGKALVSVTGEWQEKVLPVSVFSGIRDLSEMTEFVVVFDDRNSNPKTGAIYIDNIYVKK
jgi:hypothetical protein